jgi:hypothetical protein
MTSPVDRQDEDADDDAPHAPDRARASSEKGTGADDSPLDSLGKAITAPIEGAAEGEEPPDNPRKPPVPPA